MQTFLRNNHINEQENILISYRVSDLDCDIHTHEFVELIFIASGSCIQWIEGVKYTASAGDLLFIDYGQTHAFEAVTEDFSYYNLLYVPDFFGEELMNSENIYEIFKISMFKEFATDQAEVLWKDEASDAQLISFKGAAYPGILKIIEDMYREFREKEIGYQSVLNGYSRVLFSKILRKLKNDRISGETQKYLTRITEECLAYIDARCFEKITLKEIAERTFYNPSYFSRVFKEQCGVSLSEYIKEKRMAEVARLLATTELSNEEVMTRVGYTDKKQFYRSFREIYGLTPSQFRHK